ncbi:CMGC kinase [Cyclospora cayetanensis]|uniref:Cyclin-dependent kinase 2 homolog n=1 Tax=Cyclospora cayetanensis TaxID=88456 RepID=A0A1D3D3W5_9EIME|nr:CMGC kinase [Cyclospora cayetanensis]
MCFSVCPRLLGAIKRDRGGANGTLPLMCPAYNTSPLEWIPPEPPFQTTNGLYWVLKCRGLHTAKLPTGSVQLPVYSQLGCGQFGRVFEVLPAQPPDSAPAFAATPASDRAAKEGDLPAQTAPPSTSASAVPGYAQPPSVLPHGQLYAAKLLLLSNFPTEGSTADLVREFSLYGDLDPPGSEGLGFANVLRVYGLTSCVTFSKPFAEVYLSGVQTAGVLVVERCASDLAAFARLLHAQGKLNHSALKFYAWQLLNVSRFAAVVFPLHAVQAPITSRCLAVSHDTGLCVARLHGRGVIHRDLKPENILVAAANVPGGQQLLREGVAILKVADLEDWCLLTMRQSGRVVTLPYRPPEILAAAANNLSAAKLPVASYSSACDVWSVGVILLELCLPQKAPRPHRWNFAFVLHAVGRAAFQMEFMVLENIFKVLGKPQEHDQLLDMTRLAGDQRSDLMTFLGAFPALSHGERKAALLDFILERGGLHLDALGLDLLARFGNTVPKGSPSFAAASLSSGVGVAGPLPLQHEGSSCSSIGGSAAGLRLDNARALRSTHAAMIQRSSNSALSRKSDSASRELQRKGSDSAPLGPPVGVLTTKSASRSSSQSCLPLNRAGDQRQRPVQQKQREGPPQPATFKRRPQCAGSDDEVVRISIVNAFLCARSSRAAWPSHELSVPGVVPVLLQSAPPLLPYPLFLLALLSHNGPPHFLGVSLSGDTTPYHDALSDRSCSPLAAMACVAGPADTTDAAHCNDENVNSSQDATAMDASANTSSTRARKRGLHTGALLRGSLQGQGSLCPPDAADGKGQKTLRRAKRLRSGSGT